MIIIVARDALMRSWALKKESGASAWGTVWAIPKEQNQHEATTSLTTTINGLPVHEPVCVSGHGHNKEIGDEDSGPNDWGWDVEAFADILAGVNVRTGPILFSTCANRVTNFSARLAVRLIEMRAQKGLWAYGYNVDLPVTAPYPKPTELEADKNIQWTQVWW